MIIERLERSKKLVADSSMVFFTFSAKKVELLQRGVSAIPMPVFVMTPDVKRC